MSPDLIITLAFYVVSALALLIGVVIGSHLRQPIRLRRRRSSNPDYVPAPSKGSLTDKELHLEEDDIKAVLGEMGHPADRAAVIAREISSKGDSMLRKIGGGKRP